MLFQALWPYLPDTLLEYVRYIPTREYARFRRTLNLINRVSKELIDHKSALSEDKSSKDVMSVLGASLLFLPPSVCVADETASAQCNAPVVDSASRLSA